MTSEVRQALNEAKGIWTPEPVHDLIILSPEIPGERLARFKAGLVWLGKLSNNPTVAIVLAWLIVAALVGLIKLIF
jgi:hypothetical protein